MPRHSVHRGRKIEVFLDITEQPDGSTIRRDMIWHPGAVVILPMVDDDHVCLLRNYRFIIEETLWELPAGTLEPGEAPEAAAPRELAEETGYTAARWDKIAACYPSPGCLSELLHLYVARDLTAGPARPEADEQLEPVTVPWVDAINWALDGTLRDAKTITGILLWDRLRNGGRP